MAAVQRASQPARFFLITASTERTDLSRSKRSRRALVWAKDPELRAVISDWTMSFSKLFASMVTWTIFLYS